MVKRFALASVRIFLHGLLLPYMASSPILVRKNLHRVYCRQMCSSCQIYAILFIRCHPCPTKQSSCSNTRNDASCRIQEDERFSITLRECRSTPTIPFQFLADLASVHLQDKALNGCLVIAHSTVWTWSKVIVSNLLKHLVIDCKIFVFVSWLGIFPTATESPTGSELQLLIVRSNYRKK
ncbi:hypothetical protein Plhal703r1_c37g0133801 [Plasmopara halstedii]